MFKNENELAQGTAWLTPEGLWFEGRYYTCKKALREGWFHPAQASEPTSKAPDVEERQLPMTAIPVLFDAAAEQRDVIYIDSEEFSEELLCRVLPEKAWSETAAAYQQRIRLLQEERRELIETRRRR